MPIQYCGRCGRAIQWNVYATDAAPRLPGNTAVIAQARLLGWRCVCGYVNEYRTEGEEASDGN